jgi:hypothetical protein
MAQHRFAYPTVREIRATEPPTGDPTVRLVRPSQRRLVEASLLRRPPADGRR